MGTRILIVRLGSLGDVVLTSPTVLNLKINYQDSHICFLTRDRFAPVVRLFDGIDEVITLPDQIQMRDLIRKLHQLDKRGFDILVDLHGNFRSWLSRRMVNCDRSVTYPKRRLERRRIARRQAIPDSWPHTIDLYNDTLTQLGQTVFCRRPIMRTKSGSDTVTGSTEKRPFVLIAPGAAHETKKWGGKRFASVANHLIEERNARIGWVVLSSESSDEELNPAIPAGRCDIFRDAPFEELIDLVSSADLVLANDSGVSHLGSATGTPVVALFGPTHPCLGFAPRGLHDEVIEVEEYCRPCSVHGKKECFRDERYCFDRITDTSVTDRCLALLDKGKGDRAAFLDRDGTIIVEKQYLADPEGVELEKGAASALRRLNEAGFKLVSVSNQSGIARGFFKPAVVDAVNRRMAELLAAERVELDAVYYCPHHERDGVDPLYKIPCDCRKPGPGMAEQAALDLGLDLRRSAVIGDSLVDLNLARTIGAAPALVRTGYGRKTEDNLTGSTGIRGLVVGDNLEDVALQLVKGSGNA